jgi:phosphodiesterase/alkaline phosphatase D-like protein
VDETAFAWSIQTADATDTSVLVGCRTTLPGPLTLTLVRAQDDAWVDDQTHSVDVDAGYAQIELTDLDADTAYRVVLGAEGSRTPVGRFRTALGPGQDRRVVFGASSCMGSTGKPWWTLTHAGAAELDFFALLGDMVYADGSVTAADYDAEWRDAMQVAGMADLCAGTSVIATWDDHEVDNNWVLDETVTQDQVDAALTAFRRALPQRTGPAGGMWRTLRWGATLDVFVMDCRGERGPGWPQMVSPEQLEWLTQELAASTATFKVVLNSVQVTDWSPVLATAASDDRWQGYPEQRAALLEAAEGVSGVLFVTGDLHFGALTRVGQAGETGEDLWEVMAGPAGSRVNGVPGFFTGDRTQFPILVTEGWSWCRLVADAGLGTLLVEFRDDDDVVVASQELRL